MKKAHIEAGVIRFVEKVEVVVSLIEILLRVSAMYSRQPGCFPKISKATGNQGAHTPGEGASEGAGPSMPPQRIQDTQSVQANEITRLDGEVTKLQETPFARGTYCEVWEGQWVKIGGEVEKVSLSFTTSVLLTGLFVGGLESTSNREGA